MPSSNAFRTNQARAFMGIVGGALAASAGADWEKPDDRDLPPGLRLATLLLPA